MLEELGSDTAEFIASQIQDAVEIRVSLCVGHSSYYQ